MKSIRFIALILTIAMLVIASPSMSLEWGELEGKIKGTIEELNLSKHSIETKYSSGKLTVSGYVSSDAERDKVIDALGKLHGISSVDNQLTIGSNGNGATDASVSLRRAVLNEIRQLKGLGTYSIEVRPSEDGKVTLEGKVASIEDKKRVEETAQRVLGDGKLASNLVVKSTNSPDLATNILSALKAEKDIDVTGVSVKADNGIVTIAGTKASHREIDRILSIANMVDGVKEVKSAMVIGK